MYRLLLQTCYYSAALSSSSVLSSFSSAAGACRRKHCPFAFQTLHTCVPKVHFACQNLHTSSASASPFSAGASFSSFCSSGLSAVASFTFLFLGGVCLRSQSACDARWQRRQAAHAQSMQWKHLPFSSLVVLPAVMSEEKQKSYKCYNIRTHLNTDF